MDCGKCGKRMILAKGMPFNDSKIDGFRCVSCGEVFFDPEQAQRILLLNRLKKERIKARLGRIKSNLILRMPKDIEVVLGLKKGQEVFLRIVDDELRVAK